MATKSKVPGKKSVDPVSTPESQSTIAPRNKALVFISHDSRDADIAEALANLLSDVSAGTLKSFRSSDKKGSTGIEFGAEWYTTIMSQLGDATDVVALLTQRSIDRPWILYEAGVAKGKLDSTVLGLAIGVPLERVSTGPFGQFQNCGDDEDSITKLVMQLLQRNPDAAPREEAVKRQVRIFIEAIAKMQLAKPKKEQAGTPVSEEQTAAKLFEEVKAMVRELPDRVEDRVRSSSRKFSNKKGRRIHPMLIEELLFRFNSADDIKGPAAGLLLVLSIFKDDVPWLYEAGMDLYRAMLSGDTQAIRRTNEQFRLTYDVAMNGPWLHEIARPEDEEVYFALRHLPEMLDHLLKGVRSLRNVRSHTSSKNPDSGSKNA